MLTGFYPKQRYPEALRRIKYCDPEGRVLVFLTNDFSLPALTIAELYKARWQIELFFKWIKQHLRIKAFFGASANAVKTQIWIAACIYLLIAITKKRLKTEQALYRLQEQTVEPVFGIIKEVMGFRRFSMRGKEKAETEWRLVCLSYNLKKMFKLSQGCVPKRPAAPAKQHVQTFSGRIPAYMTAFPCSARSILTLLLNS